MSISDGLFKIGRCGCLPMGRDFACSILRLDNSHSVLCTFSKVRHLRVLLTIAGLPRPRCVAMCTHCNSKRVCGSECVMDACVTYCCVYFGAAVGRFCILCKKRYTWYQNKAEICSSGIIIRCKITCRIAPHPTPTLPTHPVLRKFGCKSTLITTRSLPVGVG